MFTDILQSEIWLLLPQYLIRLLSDGKLVLLIQIAVVPLPLLADIGLRLHEVLPVLVVVVVLVILIVVIVVVVLSVLELMIGPRHMCKDYVVVTTSR